VTFHYILRYPFLPLSTSAWVILFVDIVLRCYHLSFPRVFHEHRGKALTTPRQRQAASLSSPLSPTLLIVTLLMGRDRFSTTHEYAIHYHTATDKVPRTNGDPLPYTHCSVPRTDRDPVTHTNFSRTTHGPLSTTVEPMLK
jgi:hypothetical protein